MRVNIAKRKSEYTRVYSGLRGVSLGNDCEAGVKRLAYAENVYRDYASESDGVIESVPGFRKLCTLNERINGIFIQKVPGGEDFFLIHAGDGLYRFPVSEKDGTASPQKIGTLADRKSRGFAFGSRYFILDGDSITAVDGNGGVARIGEGIECYVPTLYVSGQRHEQRNLISNRFKEEILVTDGSEIEESTDSLKYFVTDSTRKTCMVVGISSDFEGAVRIPGKVKIGDEFYAVTAIGERAFYKNEKISSVWLSEGCTKICKMAFWYATGLRNVILPDTLTEIEYGAFADCSSLASVHFGAGIRTLGMNVFSACTSLEVIKYALDEANFKTVENISDVTTVTKEYGVQKGNTLILLSINTKASNIDSVAADGVPIVFEQVGDSPEGLHARIEVSAPWDLNGKVLTVEGSLPPVSGSFGGKTDGVEVDSCAAVSGCTLAEIFDGRLFLSGNPALPGTVFYSSTTTAEADGPLYFGEYNYFADGAGVYPVISMLAVRDNLAVFKSGDDGSGTIFYHRAEATGDNVVPKIYPVSYVHSGVCATGPSITFLDDPLFLSPLGLSALEKQQINYDRSVVSRSRNVNFDLLKENLSEAYLVPFEDYLCVCVGAKIYMADSRAQFTDSMGIREYEWFIINGVGAYTGDKRIYRYSAVSYSEAPAHPTKQDQICPNQYVYSKHIDGVGPVLFSRESDDHYSVEATDEYTGGEISYASVFGGDGRLLLFGTESGTVCIFNNDKRGVAPVRVMTDPDFDPLEYQEKMGNKIHPDFYDFDRHRVKYVIRTCLDDCGIPHLTKSTSKHSLVVKCKSYSSTQLCCEVGTDGEGYREVVRFGGGNFDFSNLDFSALSMSTEEHTTLPIAEKAKGWIEKQITLWSEEFRCPIGIYAIAFRYTVKGRIKRS